MGPGREFLLLGLKVNLRLSPQFNLALQRFEVPLNPVHADGERINQVEALGMLGEDRREIAAECHIGADEDPQAGGESQTNGLVVGVTNADGETASSHLCFEIKHAKHLHAIGRDCAFLLDNPDVTKARVSNAWSTYRAHQSAARTAVRIAKP